MIKRYSLANFTNQYQLSKTLRFELKPVGKTAEYIKEHKIIGVEGNDLTGIDAERAVNYKHAKLILDEMHRLFIEDALKFNPDSENYHLLAARITELYSEKKIEEKKLPGKILKTILDDTANMWISRYKQETPWMWEENIKELEEKKNVSNVRRDIENYKRLIKKLKKNCENPPVKKSDCGVFYDSNEDPLKLLEWKIWRGDIKLNFKELKQGESKKFISRKVLKKYIRNFYKFSTYFAGYNDNRKNIYEIKGAKSTSLLHRIFLDNMQFHFANIKKWKTVKKSLGKYAKTFTEKTYDWKKELEECEKKLIFCAEELFKPESFNQFINQSGIERYNEILDGQAQVDGKAKPQGLNEFINLARQKAGTKRGEFSPLQLMYKQILSKNDKTFIAAFEYDTEMFDAVRNFYEECFINPGNNKLSMVCEFMKDFAEMAEELNVRKNYIYLDKDKLNHFSYDLTGCWNTLKLRLLNEYGKNVFNKNKVFSIADIEIALDKEIDGANFAATNIKAEYYKKADDIFLHYFSNRIKEILKNLLASWENLEEYGVLELKELDKNRGKEGEKGYEQIARLKTFLDNGNEFLNFIKDLNVKTDKLPSNAINDWYEKLNDFINQFHIITLYNKVRNHITRKPYSLDKIKINFENSTLLDGWDRNKESNNCGILLEKNGLYYLGIMTSLSNQLFDYEFSEKDSAKIRAQKHVLAKKVLDKNGTNIYRKVNYKLLPGPNKMLPKVFFAKSNAELFRPSAKITKIKENKLYSKDNIEKHGIQNLHDYIDFCKDALCRHPEWSKAYGFTPDSFRKTTQYKSIDQFYKDVESMGYSISFDNVREAYINEKVENGELYLFQIYNKDFSQERKKERANRKENLHTYYWKALFDERNLKDIVFKLNGQAEIFFRKASIKLSDVKKCKGHHCEKLKDKFNYPIIKDRRFTENKFLFHCPIGMNFKAPSIPGRFNTKINTFLQNNPNINVIGIDRGEKHLLYYSVVNQDGDIIKQGSLNTIANGFIPKGETVERCIDYNAKLDEKEKKRDLAHKSWGVIENIKELKAGYLSQVVHKLSKLIIKYNAIVILEELNQGLRRGRFKVEKQVYQKFERALIEKLNYLVFKSKKNHLEAGHYLNAYQLTNKFESFEKVGRQSGILFYTVASYTSGTDPVTGFLKNVYVNYESIEKSVKFWNSFDSIIYNVENDRFEFTYTLGKISSIKANTEKNESKIVKNQWTVCSSVERSRYIKPELTEEQKQTLDRKSIGKLGIHELFKVTDKLKALFDGKINYRENPKLKSRLCMIKDAVFHRKCLYYFNAIMNMRVTDSGADKGTNKNDFILSPVEPFFDSRSGCKKLPENGDANGAYNIARKGICILKKLNTASDISRPEILIDKKFWQDYAQSCETLKKQLEKMK